MAMRFLLFLVVVSAVSAQSTLRSSLRKSPEQSGAGRNRDASDLEIVSYPLEENATASVSDIRGLSVADGEIFRPLDCNSNPCSKGMTTWTQAGFNPYYKTVVIPCGLCVTMDYSESDTLELPKGLDVQGTLRFPDGYKLILKTPFVRVQGNLYMKASKPVTDTPNVKIFLTASESEDSAFVPASNNRFACTKTSDRPNAEACEVGKKSFVVAGGSIDIVGLPETCPTWVHLQSVVKGKIETPKKFKTLPQLDPEHQNRRCRSLEPYMTDDFDSGENPYGWTGGYGAYFNVTRRGTFRVSRRKSADDQGPLWDMMRFRECLIPEQEYLFRARVRLSKPGVAAGTPTTCTTSDEYCLVLQSKIRDANGKALYGRKESMNMDQPTQYGVWFDFYAKFSYSKDELHPDNIYQLLLLRGPEAGVNIEMDDVSFSLPSVETVPDPSNVCGGNLILNGNAQSDSIHPYPVESRGGQLSVETMPGGNNYFRLYGRFEDYDAIVSEFSAPGCIEANGEYQVSVRIRVDSDTPVESQLTLRSNLAGGKSERQKLVVCPPSTRDTWVVCETGITIEPKLVDGVVESLRLHIETIDAPTVTVDADDIILQGLDGPVSSIIVPDSGVSTCWDKGAEILITSHTLNYDDEQVRRLASTPIPIGNGMVMLELDAPIVAPTTHRDSPDFATEVALLSRNIVFEGESNKSGLHGGHFIVMHTPDVPQHLEGVEFKRFGQQGVLGKYPIHFHLCDSVEGSMVLKNTIRDSLQRCVVVHGTHNLTVSENVAYNTMGHCYMTEDGGEIDNVFSGNLGARTRKVEKLISSAETDNEPSTFWCTNPLNEWEGNVAAGSEQNGYWFELLDEVRGPTAKMPLSAGMNPKKLPLRRFENNVAHSNRRHGFRTYPNGYIPDEDAVFSKLKSYKNNEDGVFLHNSYNLVIKGGIMADNRRQVDFDRADNIQLKKTSLIGVTEEYKNVIKRQSNAPYHEEMVVGIELHGFALDNEREGATISDIKFSGFQNTGPVPTCLVHVDDEVRVGPFDYWSSFQGVEVADDVNAPWFDFSKAEKNGVSDIYLTDLDSSMRPPGSRASGTSTVISMSPALTEFLDVDKCEKMPEGSYMYCPNTCLRSIVFRTSPVGTQHTICRISEAGNPSKFIDLKSNFYVEMMREDKETPNEIENTHYRKSRYFSAALPPGNYEATFLNRSGKEVWPTYVESTVENPKCDNAMDVNAVKLNVPTTSAGTCTQLIRNGNFEMSDTGYPHWLHINTKLGLATGDGIKGSNAIVTLLDDSPEGSIGQYLDTRCLERGRQYEIQAWVKLKRNDRTVFCEGLDCPSARIRIQTPLDDGGIEFDDAILKVTNTFVSPHRENSWNLLQGVFTVTEALAQASSAFFYVHRGLAKMKMLVDDVSVSLLPEKCRELVRNGDFSTRDSTSWQKRSMRSTTPKLDIVAFNGNPAIKMSNRGSSLDSPMQHIKTGCMKEDERYLATAKVQLLNRDGSQFICDASHSKGPKECPKLRLRSFTDLDLPTERYQDHDLYAVAFTDHGLTNDGWQTVTGVFTATELDAFGEQSLLFFDDAVNSKDLVIDDVSIRHLTLNCNDLILNGDAEYDETPRFWRHYQWNDNEKIDVVRLDGNNRALQVSNRREDHDGIHQYVDARCLKRNAVWNVSAKMKVVSRKTGEGVLCDVDSPRGPYRCPMMRVLGWSAGEKMVDDTIYMSNRPIWQPEQLNTYNAEISVSAQLAECDRVSIGFRSYNLNWDLILDDVRVIPS